MLTTLRRRFALVLCRAAGLHEVASTRAELDEIRKDQRAIKNARTQELELVKTIALQTNRNTVMLKRWLEGSPALQLLEKNAQRKSEKKIILPPSADLRVSR